MTNNNRIRVSFMKHPIFANGNCSKIPHFRVGSSCPMPGMGVEIMKLLTDYLNLTIDVTESSKGGFNAIFNEIENSETDVYGKFLINTTTRAKRFDFTDPLYYTYTKIAVRRTDNSFKGIFSFLKMYSASVWISIIAGFMLFTSFGIFVRYIECRLRLRKEYNFVEIMWKMFRFQLVQPERIDFKLTAGRGSLLVFSIFQVCIFLGLFQGLLLTSVIKKSYLTPFSINDNFPQMVKDRKFFIVAADLGEWLYQKIDTDYESPFYELREALKFNPYKLVKEAEDIVEEVNEGNGAVAFMQDNDSVTLMAENYCNIVYVKSSIPPERVRLMFKKGSNFVPMFNKAIHDNTYLIQRIKQKYTKHRSSSKCAAENTEVPPLSMAPYYGLLIMFFIGISCACFIFSGELLKWAVLRV